MNGGIVAIVVGGVVLLAGQVWMAVISARESASQAWLCWLVPLYPVYYGISRWKEAWKPFLVGVLGFVMLAGGFTGWIVQFKSDVEPAISEFMDAGRARDMERAYSLFSSGSVEREEIARFIDDNYDLFEGYKDVTTTSWEETWGTDATTSYVTGQIIYTDGEWLPFEANLIKENGAWKLYQIYIGY